MPKRQGYVYQRAGRSSAQVTGSSAAANPQAYASHGKTPEDRAKGRMMLAARTRGWRVDPTELTEDTQIYSRGESLDLEVTVTRGAARGTIVSRNKAHLAPGANEARLDFNPTRGIPSPAQARTALDRQAERRKAVRA